MEVPKINSRTGEIKFKRKTSFSTIKRENVSVQPVGSSKVIVYDFVNTYEKGPSGQPEDYRVLKKPKKVDEYDICKVMEKRCKGQDLKSIIARVSQTGDVSILNQRNVIYGDGSKYPRTLGDALQKGVDGAKFLDKLTASDKEKLIKMAKDPEEFKKFIAQEEAKITKSKEKVSTSSIKTNGSVEEKGVK